MVTPNDIKGWIEQGLNCESVTVSGDGRHFDAVVVSDAFEGQSMINRHRLVYEALGDRMRADIHALSLATHTPSEQSA